MFSVLITWAPDTTENRRVVDAVRAAFDDLKLDTKVEKAAECSIAHLATADIVVIGIQKWGTAEVHPDFSELVRVFKGVTLAGRTAGIFSIGTERASARMRKALKDTEISLLEDDPVFADQKTGKSPEIADWAKKLAAFTQGSTHAHG